MAHVCVRCRVIRCQLRAPVCRIFPPPPQSVDNQATIYSISRPGYSYQAPLLRKICKATSTLPPSGSAVQIGWAPSHTGIMGNGLADAAAKLAAEATLPTTSCSHGPTPTFSLRFVADFPFSPSAKLSAIFILPRHAATRLFQMKLAASYLLGHPNWHCPEPGLCPRCEEEIETTEHAMLRCPVCQYARGSFPETLDLKSAWYDAEMLATFVQRTLTAYPPGFTPPEVIGTPPPRPSSPS